MTVNDLTAEELAVARETYAKGSTDKEWTLYLADCRRFGVLPLDKKLHFQVRKAKRNDGTWDRRYAPVTSIDYMREVADSTGKYAGNDKPAILFNDDPQMKTPYAVEYTVYKMVEGQRCPFTAVAYWDEFYPGEGANGQMWRKFPLLMLAKCAEALALRRGFPGQLAGLYEKAEMEQAGSESSDKDKAPTVPTQTMRRPAPAAPRITVEQSNDLWNLARLRQWADMDLRVFLTRNFDVSEPSALRPEQFDGAFKAIDKGPNKNLFHEEQQ